MRLEGGDCLHILRKLPENSVDAIVTDPPYGWRFMGKAWDGEDIQKRAEKTLGVEPKTKVCKDGKIRTRKLQPAQEAGAYDLSTDGNYAFQNFSEDWAREALRVLKPGGHMLVFCGPRTYHRMASGVEDAGFEIRDQLQWLFGSGFPKSLDISKAIDKAAGAEREILGKRSGGLVVKDGTTDLTNARYTQKDGQLDITTPATPEAKQWEGWGTALKPANEPILLARKPLSEKTVAANVLKWGTGGINVDAGRVEYASAADIEKRQKEESSRKSTLNNAFVDNKGMSLNVCAELKPNPITTQGRFPANLLLDETAAEMLDEQTGNLAPQGGPKKKDSVGKFYGGGTKDSTFFGDTGGASRFFYVAKASKREKGQGNTHPTVKPIKLMEYLIKLITPPNGTVLDPFMGSGSTGVAAERLGFHFIGIEKESDYLAIAQKRIESEVSLRSLRKNLE